MSGYAKQKLWEAVHALAGDGEIDARLSLAGDCLIGLQDSQIPSPYLEEFKAIKAKLFTTPLSSARSYVPRQISTEDAVALSHRIVDFFSEIMGGL
jgi:hypothetical protein